MILLSTAALGVSINAIRLNKKKKRHRRRAKLKVARFLQLRHFRLKRSRAARTIQSALAERRARITAERHALTAAKDASKAAKALVATTFVDIAIFKNKHRDKMISEAQRIREALEIRRAQKFRTVRIRQQRQRKIQRHHHYESESQESTEYSDYSNNSDY